MTSNHTYEVLDLGYTKEEALGFHLGTRFYPPLPEGHKESIVLGFKKYWAGEIGLDKLTEMCYLRNIDGLYKYFGPFIDTMD